MLEALTTAIDEVQIPLDRQGLREACSPCATGLTPASPKPSALRRRRAVEFCKGIGGTYLDTGAPVSPAELGALRCDSVLHRLLVSGASAILDYGRATRTWPPDVYNAILNRDVVAAGRGVSGQPPGPTSTTSTSGTRGGRTSIDNGCMLCRRHHRRLHGTRGWSAKLLPDGTLEVTHPDGRVEQSPPRGPVFNQFWRTGGG